MAPTNPESGEIARAEYMGQFSRSTVSSPEGKEHIVHTTFSTRVNDKDVPDEVSTALESKLKSMWRRADKKIMMVRNSRKNP